MQILFLDQLFPPFRAKGQDIVCKRRAREGGEVKEILESCSVPKSVVPGHLPSMTNLHPCKPFCQMMQGCDMYMSLFETLSLFLLMSYSRVWCHVWSWSPRGRDRNRQGVCNLCCRYPAEGGSYLGKSREGKGRSSRSCAYFMLRAVCECRPRKDLLGLSGRVTRIISFACLLQSFCGFRDTAEPRSSRAAISHAFATMTRDRTWDDMS